LLALGITSIQDASAENDFDRWELFQRWRDQGSLRCRVSLLLGLEAFEQYCDKGMPPYLSDEGVHLGGVKIILHETTGRLVPTPDELERVVARIHQSQMQVALHAVEESTVVAACSVLERVVRRYPRADHRHRIEHCSVCRRETAERLASLGALVVTQPAFVYFNGERYLRTVPRDELAHLYPIATLLKAGVRVAAGSDCPVVAPNPLIGLYAAVSRRTESGEALLPSESVSPVEAIRMYTETAAYVSREEAHKGRIVPGNYADLAVLSADPTGGPSGETRELQVDMTVLGGDVVWRRVWWE